MITTEPEQIKDRGVLNVNKLKYAIVNWILFATALCTGEGFSQSAPVGSKVLSAQALDDAAQYRRLKEYVQGVVGAFAKDDRILGWDIWNEPGSNTMGSYPKAGLKMEVKTARVTAFLPQAFAGSRNEPCPASHRRSL